MIFSKMPGWHNMCQSWVSWVSAMSGIKSTGLGIINMLKNIYTIKHTYTHTNWHCLSFTFSILHISTENEIYPRMWSMTKSRGKCEDLLKIVCCYSMRKYRASSFKRKWFHLTLTIGSNCQATGTGDGTVTFYLTHSGGKVFRIFAFFWISISQKTHLNFQNPTAMKAYRGTKPEENNLFYV